MPHSLCVSFYFSLKCTFNVQTVGIDSSIKNLFLFKNLLMILVVFEQIGIRSTAEIKSEVLMNSWWCLISSGDLINQALSQRRGTFGPSYKRTSVKITICINDLPKLKNLSSKIIIYLAGICPTYLIWVNCAFDFYANILHLMVQKL